MRRGFTVGTIRTVDGQRVIQQSVLTLWPRMDTVTSVEGPANLRNAATALQAEISRKRAAYGTIT